MPGICPTCGLPTEVCQCEQIAKDTIRLKISIDRRRYGKTVTIIEGFEGTNINVHEITKNLKNRCATGGTYKEGKVELQGEHTKKVEQILKELGFNVEIKGKFMK